MMMSEELPAERLGVVFLHLRDCMLDNQFSRDEFMIACLAMVGVLLKNDSMQVHNLQKFILDMSEHAMLLLTDFDGAKAS